MSSVRELLAGNDLPRLEKQMLLRHVLQVPRSWLIAHDTDIVPADKANAYRQFVGHRLAGQPMAYLLGHREFMGHRFTVTADVLIPRPETELLVETALLHLEGRGAPRVLDLGTGSGAIAISISLGCPAAEVVAPDVSPAALEVARGNARRLSARVEFLAGSWYHILWAAGVQAFDLIVSNPPYISARDPHLQQGDLRFEPKEALTDGADGFGALDAIIRDAPSWLKPKGALWVEHGWDQAPGVRQRLRQAGFTQVESFTDLAGIERVSGGHL
jgi:release factor glutamine methyltransferase